MLKRQRGQAFILVLILLAVGGLLITPALNLASTGLQSRMTQHTNLMEYYAADGAQDYSLWLLRDPQFVAELITSEEGEVGPFYIVLNRVQAEYSITWQAAEDAPPSDAPITEDRYKITVQVDPDGADPDYLPPDIYTVFTYTITLQYMYPDLETEPLEQLEVTLPPWFTNLEGVSGFTTDEPDRRELLKKGHILEWDFDPAISFDFFETKSMSFQAWAILDEDAYYTEAEVWTAEVPQPRGTTGPTAPVIVGNPLETGIPRLLLAKEALPKVIPPTDPDDPVGTLLTYTISLENQSSVEDAGVLYVKDALPTGFSYYPGFDIGFLLLCDGGEPSGSVIPGGTRQLLEWKFASFGLTVPAGETLTGSFQVIAIVDSSGTYANELWIKAPGVDVGEEYSWPTGGVIVPQFDIESSSGGTTLKVVTVVSGGSHNIKSWQVD